MEHSCEYCEGGDLINNMATNINEELSGESHQGMKGFWMVNEPWFMDIIFMFIKPFLTEKMKDRVRVRCTVAWSSLNAIYSTSSL